AVMALRDEQGALLKLVQPVPSQDPRFAFKFIRSGKYFVVVRDLENGGSPDFTFRLLAGRMPFIAGFLPRGERPGTTVGMQLDGPNVPAKSPATVTIPKTARLGEFWAETRLTTGHAALLPLIVDDVP